MSYPHKGMTRERYIKLSNDETLELTQAEHDGGWFFCICEWDGMLIHKDDPEAACCGCLKEGLIFGSD